MSSHWSCGEGRTHFVVSGRRLGGAHVVGKCLPEQLVGLEHEGDLVHKLVRIHFANVHTAYEHSTEETSQKRGIRLAQVDLPPPEGPTRARVLPAETLKLTWLTAGASAPS